MEDLANNILNIASEWDIDHSRELYRLENWGETYFSINKKGNIIVRPKNNDKTAIDINDIIKNLEKRKLKMPILLRFLDILGSQVSRINEAFRSAIKEANYDNEYKLVYPIKVNQLHEVVEEILDAGLEYNVGLECGSKTELVACLAHLESDDRLLICNGHKDSTMLELIIDAQMLGKNVVPIIERTDEYNDLVKLGKKKKFMPKFGLRLRLATQGAGRWAASSGLNSKFGLTIPEVLSIIDDTKDRGIIGQITTIHCHIGSQISEIQVLKQATKEIAQIYCQLKSLGAPICYLDVGGGMGINYDENTSSQDPSINYGTQEYANAIVYGIKEVCENNEVEVPCIITESGRALTAYHSVLIVPVIGRHTRDLLNGHIDEGLIKNDSLNSLFQIYQNTKVLSQFEELMEAYHDAVEKHEDIKSLFTLGYINIKERGLADQIFWTTCRLLLDKFMQLEDLDEVSEVIELKSILTDQILCDFSVFQSMLDHWAIGQAFPIIPTSRLNEEPKRRGILMDLTCDSDGKVHKYVSNENDSSFIPIHEANSNQYFLGFFLMGAYNDSMGDSHNLFGRVCEAHIYCDKEERGNFWIEKVIEGTEIQSMLNQVQYFPSDLQKRMNKIVKHQINQGLIKASLGTEIFERYLRTFEDQTYANHKESGL